MFKKLDAFNEKYRGCTCIDFSYGLKDGEYLEYWCYMRQDSIIATYVCRGNSDREIIVLDMSAADYTEVNLNSTRAYRLSSANVHNHKSNRCECGAKHTPNKNLHSHWCPEHGW